MRSTRKYVAVCTTIPSAREAAALARRIVQTRLAACAQFWPIRSVYAWKGKLESARECMLVAKTAARLSAKLTRFIREHHPYEVPEIIVTPIAGGWPPYLQWIRNETAGRKKGRGRKS